MLIVFPSLVILFAAILVVYLIKAFKREEEKEKRVINEEHLYDERNEPSYKENRRAYRENEPEPECC
jgi:predicted membrane protein